MIHAASRTSNTVLETLRLKYHNAQLVDQLASQLEKGEQTALLLNVHSEHYRFIMEYAQDIIYRSGRFTFINPAVIRLLGYHETEMLGHRALYESSPEMLLTVDAKCTLLTFNATAAAELGYEADSLIGQPVSLIVHADDQARMQHFDDCLARPGSVPRGELRTIRKDASHLWVREAARAVRNPDGRFDIIIVCENVTERKGMKDAWPHTRQLLESIVEHIPHMVFLKDARELRFVQFAKPASS